MRVVDYVDLGRYLRDVRESLHVTVEQAAVALHIRPKYLYDLEAGNLESLPGKAYLRGYIKNYAEFLQLNSREVLEEYEKLFGGHTQQFFVPQAGAHSNMPGRNILWACTAGLVAVYGVWYFLLYDHTVVENTIGEIPVDNGAAAAPKMDENWQKCLDAGEFTCFVDLLEKQDRMELKSPLMPDVPPPDAATDKDKAAAGDKNDEYDD